MKERKWTAEEVLRVLQIANATDVASLDAELPRANEMDETFTLGSAIKDPGPGPQEIIEAKELKRIVLDAVNKLPARQCQIVRMRYGLDDGVPKTLEEIANHYGVTRERVRQVEVKAFQKLKWLLLRKYKIKEFGYEDKQ